MQLRQAGKITILIALQVTEDQILGFVPQPQVTAAGNLILVDARQPNISARVFNSGKRSDHLHCCQAGSRHPQHVNYLKFLQAKNGYPLPSI